MSLFPARSCLLFLVAGAFGLLSAPADAALYCVNEGPALQAALTAASDNGVHDEIRITTGSKTITPLPTREAMFLYYSSRHENLKLSGGWNANCTQQNPNPRSTQLNGLNSRLALMLNFFGNATGDVEVSNLMLYQGRTSNFQFGSGLYVRVEETADPDLLIERAVVTLNDSATPAATAAIVVAQLQSAVGRYTLRNLMVEGNLQGAMWLNTQPGATYRINNNTITANAPPTPDHHAVYVSGTAWVWMANNVIAGNAVNVNLSMHQNTPTYLFNNHINGLIAASWAINQNMTTGDPRMELDANGWWRPMPVSPLRDSGVGNANGGIGGLDVLGSPRVRGPAVDRGAIESAPNVDILFRNGFQ